MIESIKNIRKKQIDRLNCFIDEGLAQLDRGETVTFSECKEKMMQKINKAMAEQNQDNAASL